MEYKWNFQFFHWEVYVEGAVAGLVVVAGAQISAAAVIAVVAVDQSVSNI